MYVCRPGERLAFNQYVCGAAVCVTLSCLPGRAPEFLEPPENVLGSPEVALRIVCKNKSTDLHPRFDSDHSLPLCRTEYARRVLTAE